MQVTDDIMPLSEFKTQASKILGSIKATGRSVVITQNGKPAAVVITPEEFDRLREREEFMAAVDEGRGDAKAGRVTTTAKVEEGLDRRFGKAR